MLLACVAFCSVGGFGCLFRIMVTSDDGPDTGRVEQLAAFVEMLLAAQQRHEENFARQDANFAEMKAMMSRAFPSPSPKDDEQSTLAQKTKRNDKGILLEESPTQLQHKSYKKNNHTLSTQQRSRTYQRQLSHVDFQEEDDDANASRSEERRVGKECRL